MLSKTFDTCLENVGRAFNRAIAFPTVTHVRRQEGREQRHRHRREKNRTAAWPTNTALKYTTVEPGGSVELFSQYRGLVC